MKGRWVPWGSARRTKRWTAPAVLALSLFAASAAVTQTDVEVQAAPDSAAALASAGAQVFRDACVACHGEDGRGGHGGGASLDQVTDSAMVVAMVTDGRGNMPPLGELLTAEQIRAVAAFVTTELFE